MEQVVTEIPDKHSIAVGTGRKRRIIAIEDVRTIPKAELAEAVFRAEYNVPNRKKLRYMRLMWKMIPPKTT